MKKTNFGTYVVVIMASLLMAGSSYAAEATKVFSQGAASAKAEKAAAKMAAAQTTSATDAADAKTEAALSAATAGGKNGYVANNSGTKNYVEVGEDGSITITPIKGTDGKYTTSLNSTALSDFLKTQTAFACLNAPPPSSGGGGGGGDSSSPTTYNRNGETWTESGGNNYSGSCNGNCGSPGHEQIGNSQTY